MGDETGTKRPRNSQPRDDAAEGYDSDNPSDEKLANMNWGKHPWLMKSLALALVAERKNGTKNNDGFVGEQQFKDITILLKAEAVKRGTPLPELTWTRVRGKVSDTNRDYHQPLKFMKAKSGWSWNDEECMPIASDECWDTFLATKVSFRSKRPISYDKSKADKP